MFYLTEDEAKILLHDRSTLNDTTVQEINAHIKRLTSKPYGQVSIVLDTGAKISYEESGFYLSGFDDGVEDLYNYLELGQDYLLSVQDNYQVA